MTVDKQRFDRRDSVEAHEIILGLLGDDAVRETSLPELDRKPAPWESSMQATVECLSWRNVWDNLERRQTEDALGEDIYREFPVHTRSAIATAHTLLDRGVIDPDELQAKMREVRARFEGD
ncbi:SH3-like domain-containing protein [Rhodococcus sp. (in: high G+C Gram-positive bacteria)]|uniref:SH3-like domain-containing protein n=1 Tax=Rhodococcus sp. TaxID=1831 RepID=UPI0019DDE702|nr:SH3-like domain-containing protein [Rhodococcus sp. (in: high G+C Gram-positive bacteria)]MBF0661488.1 nitrile hydratase subunit beta [Rhodococcus sp. (in: high G+C Gram-positive bacteria)]